MERRLFCIDQRVEHDVVGLGPEGVSLHESGIVDLDVLAGSGLSHDLADRRDVLVGFVGRTERPAAEEREPAET
jgi:hypothetical protein